MHSIDREAPDVKPALPWQKHVQHSVRKRHGMQAHEAGVVYEQDRTGTNVDLRFDAKRVEAAPWGCECCTDLQQAVCVCSCVRMCAAMCSCMRLCAAMCGCVRLRAAACPAFKALNLIRLDSVGSTWAAVESASQQCYETDSRRHLNESPAWMSCVLECM